MEEMNLGFRAPFPLFTDSTNAISNLLQNGSFKQKMTKFHEIRISAGYQYARNGLVHPLLIKTENNIADVFTKHNVGSKDKFFAFIDRLFGEKFKYDDFRQWIKGLIAKNFNKVRNDQVPSLDQYLAAWDY